MLHIYVDSFKNSWTTCNIIVNQINIQAIQD